jgi:hypothetical protein
MLGKPAGRARGPWRGLSRYQPVTEPETLRLLRSMVRTTTHCFASHTKRDVRAAPRAARAVADLPSLHPGSRGYRLRASRSNGSSRCIHGNNIEADGASAQQGPRAGRSPARCPAVVQMPESSMRSVAVCVKSAARRPLLGCSRAPRGCASQKLWGPRLSSPKSGLGKIILHVGRSRHRRRHHRLRGETGLVGRAQNHTNRTRSNHLPSGVTESHNPCT